MIHSICGLQNSGKSILSSWLAFIDYYRGRKVLSNMSLNFPHYRINKDFIFWLAIEQKPLRNVSFLLDEAWIWFDSQTAFNSNIGKLNGEKIKNSFCNYFFLQSSKDNSNIYLTAQHNDQNIKRIRDNLHRYTECQRVEKRPDGTYQPILIEERDLTRFRNNENVSLNDVLYIKCRNFKRILNRIESDAYNYQTTLYLKAKEWFKLYNTYEKKVII